MLLFLIDNIFKLLQLPHELKVMKSRCCPELNQQESPICVELLCLATCDLKVSAKTCKRNVPQTWLHSSSILTVLCHESFFFPTSMLNLKSFDFFFFVFVCVVKVMSNKSLLKSWVSENICSTFLPFHRSNTKSSRSASILWTYIFSSGTNVGTKEIMLIRL